MDISLKDLEPGQKYVLQARSKSATGKTSQWSTAFTHTTLSDTVAPAPVTSLTWDSVGTSFIATWVKPSLDANGKLLRDFKDYKIIITAGLETVTYYVTQERFDFSLEVNRNAFGTPEPDLDISVQARDNTGNLSTAVTANAVNPIPSDVTGLVADGITNAVTLTWNAVSDSDLKYYEVYMSTSGSGFTPGPSNLVYTGSSTSFLFPSTNYIAHYFKVRALDVFNQGSSIYASANATPESSSGIDLTPPDDPTNVDVTTSASDDGSSTITVDWDAVGSSNLSDYLVRYSTDEIAWRYINVPSTQTVALISNLLAETDYYVQVAAMSQANVKSDFVNADVYPIETAADTTPPSQPAAPTVSTTTLAVQVSHDMTKQGGGDLEADVAYLEVHASTTTGFTPDNTTLRGTIDTAGPGIDVSGVFYFPATTAITNLYWKIIAVDRSKNKSTASNQATGVPGLVLNANIADATITSAKIQSLEANKLVAGTGIINALDIKETLTIQTGGHVRSSDYNGLDTGWSLDNTGLFIYGGQIDAAALRLQDSANIVPPAFADFEFNEDYYHTSGIANSTVMSTVGTAVNVDIIETDKRFGNKCLRLYNTAITNPTVHDLIFAPGGLAATGVNIEVSPGTYILSAYVKKNGSVNGLLKLGLYPETGSAIVSSSFPVNTASWIRFEAQLVVPSGVSRVKAYIEIGPAAANTGYDVLIDGIQLERKQTGSITAGQWRPPSKTTIDGGQIVTGSIRSSAPSATVEDQPAWSINTAGNMQVGDALVRGVLTVGSISSPTINGMPDQFASFEKESSFYADTDNMAAPSGVGLTATVATSGGAQFGSQYLRLLSATMVGNNDLSSFGNVYLSPAPSNDVETNNIVIAPGQEYIISYYVKNLNPAKQVKLQVGVRQTPSFFLEAKPLGGGDGEIDISAYTTWTRITLFYTGAPNITSGKLCFLPYPLTGTTGFDIAIDGVMIEERTSESQTTPSTYVNGYLEDSYIASANFVTGQAGWRIDGVGNAEFNQTTIRGFLSTASELGAVEINLLDTRPTIKLWNDDYSNFGWINVVDDVAGMANIGINSGPLASVKYPGLTIYNRLFMLQPAGVSHLGFVNQTDQSRVGGNLSWSDSYAILQFRNDASQVRSRLLSDDTQLTLETWEAGTGIIKSQLALDETGSALLSANSNDLSVRVFDRTEMYMDYSTGTISLRGGDGTSLNGKIFEFGGSGTPYFHLLNEGWTNLTINSGSAIGVNPPQVKLLPDGTCILRGGMTGHSTTANATLATLPNSKYYPARTGRYVVGSEGGGVLHMVNINTDGTLTYGTPGSSTSTHFNGIVYSTV